MNEKIKELMQKATNLEKGPPNWDMSANTVVETFDRQKFAELIIKECAKFLEENSGYDDSNNTWHPEPEDLLNHFGVKE
jgi:hypothetical protein